MLIMSNNVNTENYTKKTDGSTSMLKITSNYPGPWFPSLAPGIKPGKTQGFIPGFHPC